MSTALKLGFQPSKDSGHALADTLLAIALDVCPEAVAISENAQLIYRNRAFAETFGESAQLPPRNSGTETSWQSTEFSAGGRKLLLLTSRPAAPVSNSQHLELIGRLVGGVAHDFNNLLTGILLYCDLMQNKIPRSNPIVQKIEEIRIAAEQGAGLVRQLMSVGREDTNAPRSVAFNAALRDFSPLLRHLVGEKFHLNVKLGDGEGLVAVSQAQAQQIVLNLVLNARDAMPAGGEVWLNTVSRQFEGTGPADRILELTVKDHGAGMEPHTAACIFEPYFTTKPPGRGMGMGLTTVRKIVEDAGGIIQVETAPGKGTQFTVRLPEIQSQHPHSATPPPSELDTNSRDNRGNAL